MKRNRLFILPAASIAMLIAGYGCWQLLLETGGYWSSHGFRIDGKAYRAIQEAQRLEPGSHLVVQSQSALVGPEIFTEIHFAQTFQDKGFVTITTRGVTIEIERYLYDQRVLRPLISHTGDKPMAGYTLSFAG